jgi:quercetin dioxygenase-like cupin family protein
MTRAGDFFENPVTGERVLVRVGGADTHGRYLSVDAWVGPRSVAHEHVHPHSRERFTVLNGWVRVLVDGEERDVRAGETVEFAPVCPTTTGTRARARRTSSSRSGTPSASRR